MSSETSKKGKPLYAFSWYGGKVRHVDFILNHLPECFHYCEPFGGAATVLLNRERSLVETYNDIDGEVVNFFRVLRQDPDRLIYALALTPHSREEFNLSKESSEDLSPLERARRFFVNCNQSFSSARRGWSFVRGINRNIYLRNLKKIGNLEWVACRLLSAQIENDDAIEVILKTDSQSTLFYCDPPYLGSTRTDRAVYHHEINEDYHMRLATVLNKVKGKVAVSGYDSSLYDELYPPGKWRKVKADVKCLESSKGRKCQEVLWMNYPDFSQHE